MIKLAQPSSHGEWQRMKDNVEYDSLAQTELSTTGK